ncbi:hypothetical protein Vadar_034696 [Vaccinium darrowii]|uniref:Uncharacterized protein n=1 Tax=Vaccinium darrowii TaxID=229202 RepID=A0ACB7XWZ0_9ERIC|nr:hypothetical protein Vadar_034696 [Vaccinium darrowii]
MVENDIVKEKLDDALDTIDDIEAHKLSQELEQNQNEKNKELESQSQGTIGHESNEDNEPESQNQCTIGLESNEECNDEREAEFVNEAIVEHEKDEEHRDEIMGPCDKKQEEDNDSTEPKQSDHEMVTDEDLERTITIACKGIVVEETQKKKPHRQKVEIDPSSLVKRVTQRETRSGKRIQDYIYTEDEKKKKNVKDDKKKNKKDAERQKKDKQEKQKWMPQKSRLYHMLPKEDRNLLDQICDCERQDDAIAVWTNLESQETVALQDIIRLLEEGDTANAVIDGFANMLERQQEARQANNGNNAYFTCICWTLITTSNHESVRHCLIDQKLQKVYDNILEHGTGYYHYLVFPMNSTGNRKVTKRVTPYHWTLLLYDMEEQIWKHYNSLSRKNSAYLLDATQVKTYVEGFIKTNFNARPKFRLSSSPIVFEARKFDAPIISVKNAPQQMPTSVDCGILVCYIISLLESQQEIPSSIEQNSVEEFRVHLVSKFLNDVDRSWKLED